MSIIKADIRLKIGKKENRRLRINNRCPAIIYGGNKKIILLEIDQNILNNCQLEKEFHSKMHTISIGHDNINVKIKAIQSHPFKKKFYHIDFIYA